MKHIQTNLNKHDTLAGSCGARVKGCPCLFYLLLFLYIISFYFISFYSILFISFYFMLIYFFILFSTYFLLFFCLFFLILFHLFSFLSYLLVVFLLYNILRHLHKQEMELLICVSISFHFFQLFTELCWGKMSFFCLK